MRKVRLSFLPCVICLTCGAWAQQNVPPPQKPADDGPSLEVTMKFIQEKLASEDDVRWTRTDDLTGLTMRESHEVREASADPSTCVLKYRYTSKASDENGGPQENDDDSFVASFKDVEKVVAENIESYFNRAWDRVGAKGVHTTVSPTLFQVTLIAATKLFKDHSVISFEGKQTISDTPYTELPLIVHDEDMANRVAKAIVHAMELCKSEPEPKSYAKNEAATHYNLGNVLYDKFDYDGAIAEYRTAISQQPNYPEAHYRLGVALELKHDSDGAIAEYRTAISQQPNYPNAHYNLGFALHDRYDFDGAITEYRTAISQRPNFANAHLNLGAALVAKGDTDGAIVEYRTAISQSPDFFEPHYKLGLALFIKGDTDAAVAEYRTAIGLRTGDPEVHYQLGNALDDKGDADQAIAEWREAIRLRPNYPEAQSSLDKAVQAKGKPKP